MADVDAIAVVGMACRFPGAPNLSAYRRLLRAGESGRRVYTQAELAAAGVPSDLRQHPNYVPVGYPIDGFDRFDAGFFRVTPEDAAQMDPQQRVFLEVAYHAIEDAGLRVWADGVQVGVFASANLSTYLLFNLGGELDPRRPSRALELLLANDKDYVSSRVAYKLDLKGPAVTVQTACSSSLVAICQAAGSLLNYECDAALAGGVAIRLPHEVGYLHEPGGFLSPAGECRAFDAEARGAAFGNGAGVVVLKRLEDAQSDGDRIHAVIRGFAVNNDGAQKAGYTAPGVDGQARVIAAAQAAAGVSPDEIGMVEAHGTGTALGDPIEIAALRRAFGEGGGRRDRCWIGSAKSNIGHCDSAAGIAGFIKAAIAVRDGEIPPTINFTRPNPALPLDGSPFEICTRLEPWPRIPGPRRAGVSSFGMGGVNAHVVIEAPPVPTSPRGPKGALGRRTIYCSAATPAALRELAAAARDRLAAADQTEFAAIAAATASRRRPHICRLAVLAESGPSAAAAIESALEGPGAGLASAPAAPVFLFSGQGVIRPKAGAALYRAEPTFRAALDRLIDVAGDAELRFHLQRWFREGDADAPDLGWTAPVTAFSLQYGLVALWAAWGLRPAAVLGHSLGEYAAAVAVGAMDPATGLNTVAERSRLMDRLTAPGGMLAVSLPPQEAIERLTAAGVGLDVAAINGPRAIALSGARDSIVQAEAILREGGIRCERLAIGHACHSALIDPMRPAFDAWLAAQTFAPLRATMFSSFTGKALSSADAAYWSEQVRGPVAFAAALDCAIAAGHRCFVELGAAPALSVLGRMSRREPDLIWIPTLSPGDELQAAETAFTKAWMAGTAERPREAHEPSVMTDLPDYPFARERHWREPPGPVYRDEAAEVGEAVVLAAQAVPAELSVEAVSRKRRAVDAFALAEMEAAVRRLAASLDLSAGHDAEAIVAACAPAPQHRSLVAAWLRLLRESGRLHQDEAGRCYFGAGAADRESVRFALCSAFAPSDFEPGYMIANADRLDDIVTGRLSPLETLMPRGGFHIVDAMYRSSAPARYFNSLAAAAASAIAAHRGEGLRVIELGAGTGGMTSAVLPAVSPALAEYLYTDVTDFFFARARREFHHPAVHFRTLDIERPPADAPRGYDLVVASNVLHAAADLASAVRVAADMLAPGGWLLLNELTANETAHATTVALVEGWRKYDDGYRHDGPLVSIEVWREVLSTAGLADVSACPFDRDDLGQHLILARRTGDWIRRDAGSRVTYRAPVGAAAHTAPARSGRLKAVLSSLSPKERGPRLLEILRERAAALVGVAPAELPDGEAGFFDYGLDSLKVVGFAAELSDDLDLEIESALLFDHPNVPALAEAILARLATTVARPADDVQRDAEMSDAALLAALEARLGRDVHD